MPWYYVNRSGKKCGPITSEAIRTLATSGIVTPDTLVAKTESGAMVPASKVKGLFPEPVVEQEAEQATEPAAEQQLVTGTGSGGESRNRFGFVGSSIEERKRKAEERKRKREQERTLEANRDANKMASAEWHAEHEAKLARQLPVYAASYATPNSQVQPNLILNVIKILIVCILMYSTYSCINGCGKNSSNTPDTHPKEWYVGGTLHKSSLREFVNASYENQKATAADWICAALNSENRKPQSMDAVELMAGRVVSEMGDAYIPSISGSQPSSDIFIAIWIFIKDEYKTVLK